MAKIIKCDDTTITIGMDDKSIKEVRVSDCNFLPAIGKEVDVYETDTQIIVTEVTPSETIKPQEQGINILINNENKNTAPTAPIYMGGKVVNKIVYLILTFFLGGFGVHKFYSGKIGTGILFLVFSWTFIPGLIALIEFIIACFKTPDMHGNIVV